MALDDNNENVQSTLLQQLCREKIEPLTKEGILSESLKNLRWAGLGLTIGIVGGIILLHVGPISTDKERFVLFYLLDSILNLLNPILPYVFFFIALMGLILFIITLKNYFKTKYQSIYEFSCPQCQRKLLFAQSKNEFEIVCPECFTIIKRDKTGMVDLHHCEYCGFTSFGPPNEFVTCPSCNYTDGITQKECEHCKKSIPKNVSYCRECNSLFYPVDTYFVKKNSPTNIYNIIYSSANLTKILVADMESSIVRSYQNFIDRNGIHHSDYAIMIPQIESSFELLKKCTLATQWCNAKNEKIPGEVKNRLAEYSAHLNDFINRLIKNNSIRSDHQAKFLQIVSEAIMTFSV